MKKLLKGTGAAIGYFVLYFVINLLVIFTGGIYLGIKEGLKGMDRPGSFRSLPRTIELIYENVMLLNIIIAVICLFVFWLIILLSKTSVKERLDLNPIPITDVWPLLIFGVAVNIFISYLISFLPLPENWLQEYDKALKILGDKITFAQIISVVFFAPVLEEVLYRELITKSLQNGMPKTAAILIQALLFGIMHGQLLWICYSTLLGILLAVIKLKYNSLYACILVHLSFNSTNYLLKPFYDRFHVNIYIGILLFASSLVISVFMAVRIFRKRITVFLQE
ncbi:MAG: CPBP family intramembrane metalloprotease [Clostridiaceae bacterium]|nr:CPBP family intramembrane metalloprotease [Clostridiaceae bacterium]